MCGYIGLFKSSGHIFGYMHKCWSYVGYIVKSYELVILWSYDIEGRGEWVFGQLVGYMWYLYVYGHHFHWVISILVLNHVLNLKLY